MLGIVSDEDVDDVAKMDQEAHPYPKKAPTPKQETSKENSNDKLSSVQINKLHQMTDKHPGLLLGTVKSGGYAKVEDVPANQYKPLVELLQKQMNQKS
jgi:hypothetical protein